MQRERVAALGIGTLAVIVGAAFLLLVGAPIALALRNVMAFAAGIGLGCLGLSSNRESRPFGRVSR